MVCVPLCAAACLPAQCVLNCAWGCSLAVCVEHLPPLDAGPVPLIGEAAERVC